MKAEIHPDYHEITVALTDGSSFKTRSTWGKEGNTLQLDVDPKSHPAWVGGISLRKTGRVEKFSNRFGDLSFGAASAEKKEDEAK
jgi:large subunit ribosomal protein L31